MHLWTLCLQVAVLLLRVNGEGRQLHNISWQPGKNHKYMPPDEELMLLQQRLDIDSHISKVKNRGWDILGELKNLIKSFKKLDKCLNQQPKYKVMRVLDFFSDRMKDIGDPGKIWNDFQKTYVNDAMHSAIEWTQEELKAALKKVQAELIKLEEGKSTKLDAGHIARMIDHVWAIEDRLFNKKGFLPMKCLSDIFIQPHRKRLKGLIVGFVNTVLTPVKNWFADVMKVAMDWISKAISKLVKWGFYKSLEKKVSKHVTENAAQSCLGSITEATTALMLAKANKDYAQARLIYRQLNGKIPAKIIGQVTASALSFSLSDIFAEVMDSTVAPVMEWVLGALNSLLQTTLHGVNGVCGLIPEAGDAVCALITNTIDGAQSFINDHLGKEAVQAIENYFKKLVSYNTLEPPISKALANGVGKFGSEITGSLKKIGVPGAQKWLSIGEHAIGIVVEKLATKVLPTTMKSLGGCLQARRKAAQSAKAFSKRRFSLLEGQSEAEPSQVVLLESFVHDPLFAGATSSLDHNHGLHGDWILDLPFQPQPEHAAKWKQEHLSLMQQHDQILSMSQRESSFVSVNVSDTDTESTGKVWINKRCTQSKWRFDLWGRNKLVWVGWRRGGFRLRWHFGFKYMKARTCEFGNNWAMPLNWWCPKKRTVWHGELNIFHINKFEKCYNDQNWVEQLIRGIEILPSITKVLDSINGCLNQLTGEDAKWKLDKIISFYSKRAWDPVRLIKDLDAVYLAPTVKALDPWFHKTVKMVMMDGEELLKRISDGKVKFDTKWAQGVVETGWNIIASEKDGLVSVKGLGVLKCLGRAFGEPIYKASKDHLATIILDVVKPAAAFLADSVKALEKWFQEKVEESMNGDDWFSQLAKMTRGVILKTCMDKFNALDKKNRLISDGKLELATVGKNLVPPFFAKVKVWAIYHIVAPLGKMLQKASREVSNMILHGVDALAGLVPFWGGFAGAAASSAGSLGKQLESTFSYKTILAGFEKLFTAIEKDTVHNVVLGLTKMQEELSKNPIGKIVLKILRKVVRVVGGPLVRQCTSSIDRLASLRNFSQSEFDKLKKKMKKIKIRKPKAIPKQCRGFRLARLKRSTLPAAFRKSKLHPGQVIMYSITVGGRIEQRISDSKSLKDKKGEVWHVLGVHQAFFGMKEVFKKGDGPCVGGHYRNTIVTYQFGKKYKVIRAKQVKMCTFRFLVQLPEFVCTQTPWPTPRPTPRPTPKPKPFWSQCYKDEVCRKNLSNRQVLTNGYGSQHWNAFRRRGENGWVGRNDCIQRECMDSNLIWNQQHWQDCGGWYFKGKCDKWR